MRSSVAEHRPRTGNRTKPHERLCRECTAGRRDNRNLLTGYQGQKRAALLQLLVVFQRLSQSSRFSSHGSHGSLLGRVQDVLWPLTGRVLSQSSERERESAAGWRVPIRLYTESIPLSWAQAIIRMSFFSLGKRSSRPARRACSNSASAARTSWPSTFGISWRVGGGLSGRAMKGTGLKPAPQAERQLHRWSQTQDTQHPYPSSIHLPREILLVPT